MKYIKPLNEAREQGKVKTSKHVKSYHELYGDDEETNEALISADDQAYLNQITSFLKKYKDDRGITNDKNFTSEVIKVLKQRVDDREGLVKKRFQRILKNIEKDFKKGNYLKLNESFQLTEGVMSDLNQLAAKVKNEDEFIKQFFKEYGAKVKKTADSIDWVKSLYQDAVNEADYTVAGRPVTLKPGKKSDGTDWTVIFKNGKKVSLAEVLALITPFPTGITESLNEDKAEGDRGPIDDEKIETALKKKEEETGVPMEFLRIIMRRGMAAWRTGHRPGTTQQQWGYSRVNSFLTKQPGTWGGADADVAKEVRDGGYDKKLKKG